MPTYFDSNVSRFFLADSASSSIDISDHIIAVDGLPGQMKYNPVTTFGKTGETYNPSINVSEFTLEAVYNEDTSSGSDTIIGYMYSNKVKKAFQYFPSGTSAGTQISGNCYCDNYNIPSRAGNTVLVRAHFLVDNGITRTS